MGVPENHPAIRAAKAKGLIPAPPAKPRPAVTTSAPRGLVVEAAVPVRTASEPNTGGTLRGKCARKRQVKEATAAALPPFTFPLPAVVTLTRGGVGELDDDNLRGALKAVRDEVARWLGVDDRDPRVRWRYRQVPAWAAYVRVRAEHKG